MECRYREKSQFQQNRDVLIEASEAIYRRPDSTESRYILWLVNCKYECLPFSKLPKEGFSLIVLSEKMMRDGLTFNEWQTVFEKTTQLKRNSKK